MTAQAAPQTLEFPQTAPPAPGETIELRPGIFWARLALPFRLDHVNVYLIEDNGGLALVDTGIDNRTTREAWDALFAGAAQRPEADPRHCHPLSSRPYRSGWMAVRKIRPAARDEPDRISDGRSTSATTRLRSSPSPIAASTARTG